MAGNVLGIFAKQPLPGRVKTRLCPPFSHEQAAQLYQTCLEETVAAMAQAPAERVLFYDGDRNFFEQTFPGLRLLPQSGGDLGRRLDQALQQLFTAGWQRAVLIGSDSPDLPVKLVADAFAALASYELAVAPARDGGYVLIGESRHSPQLFSDMPWSTAELWPATRHRAAELELSCCELDEWEDLDDLAALQRLYRRAPESPTALLAARLLASNPFL